MINPILKNERSIYYYLLIWLLAGSCQCFTLFYFYKIPLTAAISDSLVFNFLFGFLALNLWYVVKYINIDTSTPLGIVVNHLFIAFLLLTTWLFIGFSILHILPWIESIYHVFLQDSLPGRFFIGLFFYSFVVLLYYSIIYYSNYQDKSRHEAQLQTLIKEAELNILKSQINPHFIFNSLNSISSLTISKPEQAREMIIKLSDFLRYALDQDMKQKTLMKNELENISRYLDIEKIRFGKRLNLIMNVEENCKESTLPNMILQPLLENAVKHGVYESTEPITLTFTAFTDHGVLRVLLKNDFDEEVKGKKSSGMGIKNIQNRLRLIYGRTDLLKINKTENTFEVSLIFPQV